MKNTKSYNLVLTEQQIHTMLDSLTTNYFTSRAVRDLSRTIAVQVGKQGGTSKGVGLYKGKMILDISDIK